MKASKRLRKILAAASLAAIVLTGCGKTSVEHQTTAPWVDALLQEAPKNEEAFLAGMFKADEETAWFDNSEETQATATAGELLSGGYFRETDKYTVYLNAYGNVLIPKAEDQQEISGVYEKYTGKVLTVQEYNYLYFWDFATREGAEKAMLEPIEEAYVEMAMYDESLSPEGLTLTLEHAKNRYYNDFYVFLNGDGEEVFRKFTYQSDRRDGLWEQYFACTYYEDVTVRYLNVDMPGAGSIKENMLSKAEAFVNRRVGEDWYQENDAWVAGRYLVFRQKLSDTHSGETHYYFLNLLTGQEESYAQVYGNMGMDKTLLSEEIRQLVDKDYQEYYQTKSGTPFSWEHNEELYQRTMAQANADGVLVIPGDELTVVYNAYMTEDGVPEQRELKFYELWWPGDDGTGHTASLDMAVYTGLEEMMVSYLSAVEGRF